MITWRYKSQSKIKGGWYRYRGIRIRWLILRISKLIIRICFTRIGRNISKDKSNNCNHPYRRRRQTRLKCYWDIRSRSKTRKNNIFVTSSNNQCSNNSKRKNYSNTIRDNSNDKNSNSLIQSNKEMSNKSKDNYRSWNKELKK